MNEIERVEEWLERSDHRLWVLGSTYDEAYRLYLSEGGEPLLEGINGFRKTVNEWRKGEFRMWTGPRGKRAVSNEPLSLTPKQWAKVEAAMDKAKAFEKHINPLVTARKVSESMKITAYAVREVLRMRKGTEWVEACDSTPI